MQKRSSTLFAPRDWEALRRAYESHTGGLADLAAASNIQPETLRRYARQLKWQLPPAISPTPPAVMTSPSATAAVITSTITDAAPTTRILSRRLRRAIGRQLDTLEQIMDETPKPSPAEHERHTKTVGTLAKNLETVDGLDRADSAARGRGGSARNLAAPETAGHDADGLRRELAARIKRLRERLAR